MTHTDILIFICALLAGGISVFFLLVLHEIISDIRELKTLLEER